MENNEAEIKLINVDENGTEMEDVDWSKWDRDYVEEVKDRFGKVYLIVSHCRRFSDEELNEHLLSKLKASESEDVQAALCELAEQQAAYESDVNAALCELYDLIVGGTTDG